MQGSLTIFVKDEPVVLSFNGGQIKIRKDYQKLHEAVPVDEVTRNFLLQESYRITEILNTIKI